MDQNGQKIHKIGTNFSTEKVLKMKVFLLLILCILFVPGKSFKCISVNDNS